MLAISAAETILIILTVILIVLTVFALPFIIWTAVTTSRIWRHPATDVRFSKWGLRLVERLNLLVLDVTIQVNPTHAGFIIEQTSAKLWTSHGVVVEFELATDNRGQLHSGHQELPLIFQAEAPDDLTG